MHKNYASFALEVVVDKYLIFFNVTRMEERVHFNAFFHPNRHPSKPFSTAVDAFLMREREKDRTRFFAVANVRFHILRKRCKNISTFYDCEKNLQKFCYHEPSASTSLNPFFCLSPSAYGPKRILIRVHHCIVEQVKNLGSWRQQKMFHLNSLPVHKCLWNEIEIIETGEKRRREVAL